jgi:flagellar basal-body rod modification protein FlgD
VRLVLSLEAPGAVTVDVHDSRGRRVRRLHAGPLPAGRHGFAWDGLDEAGRAAPPGVYFVRALAATGQASRKVVVR